MMDAEQLGTTFILIGLVIYGIHPVVVEVGGLFISPLWFAALAALFAGSISVILASRPNQKPIKGLQRSDVLRLIGAGVFGTFIAFASLFIGLQFTGSNNAAVILRAELAFALLFGYSFLGETISLRQALWMILMISGVLLVVLTTQVLVLGIGDLLLIITPAAWAAGHTLAKPILNRVKCWTVVAFRNLVGGCLLLLFAITLTLWGTPVFLSPDLGLIWMVIIIEAVVILLAHSLWYLGIQRINLGKATALIAPAPLVTFLLSTVLLGLLPTLWQIVGAVVVISATILLSREQSLLRTNKISRDVTLEPAE